MSLETVYEVGEISYVENITDTKYFKNSLDYAEVTYGERVTTSRVIMPGTDQIGTVKINVIYLTFTGLAFSYDGIRIESYPSPGLKMAWPRIIALGNRLFLVGGLLQSTEINTKSYVYGDYYYMFKNYTEKYIMVYIVPSEPGQEFVVTDSEGNTLYKPPMGVFVGLGPGQALISRKPFKALYQVL